MIRRPSVLSSFSDLLCLIAMVPLAGCSDSSATDGEGAAGTGAQAAGGGAPDGGGDVGGGSGGSIVVAPHCSGPESDPQPIDTVLPSIDGLSNVRACTNGDAVNIGFDPMEGAVDYRIYPLPPDDAITTNPDGTIRVTNAIYRCAGQREALYMVPDQPGVNDNAAGGLTTVDGAVQGFTRAEADATLGCVYTKPGDGRVPVYGVGRADEGADDGFFGCSRAIFHSTRPKTYTTDASVRDALLAQGGRDEGIVFYVPSAAGGDTRAVYEGTFGDADTLRWIDGPEGTARGAGTHLFDVLTAAGADTAPLMRVHVEPYCTASHDELVAGTARFKKVRYEGDHPLTALRWSGITEETVFVVEALEGGCPYQGNLSPEHADAHTEQFGDETLQYDAYLTIDDMRSASPTGEVYVNGQYDTTAAPKPIARTFLRVAPEAPEGLDYYATFPAAEDFRSTFAAPTGNEYGLHFSSPDYMFSSYSNTQVHFGSMLGEFWASYNDIAADVNGKIRLTPNQKATLSDAGYLHITTEFDIVSSGRRYPQILISDRSAPVQDALVDGTTIVVQPKDLSPTLLQVQICDHRNWDVNDQCPMLPTFPTSLANVPVLPGERTGTDNAVKLDVFVSTSRIYLMLDDMPYSCTNLPATAEDGAVYQPPSGEVSITWGDVLYHSGVDFESGGGPVEGNSYSFHRAHMHTTTRRHFDNLGFASGGPAPAWDESLVPCAGGS